MTENDVLRKELAALLCKGNAHMTFEEVIADFPMQRINDKAPHMPYSPWHILEHMNRVQRDIVAFVQEPGYASPEWPRDFFPSPHEQSDADGWRNTVHAFLADREVLRTMAEDRRTDLFAPIPHAKSYTLFREILLAADHNAYHTGELAFMRQVMEAWPPGQPLYDAG